jgi:ADP-ribosylglycohydrolase
MEDIAKRMIRSFFAADALALGGHWVYDAATIAKTYGRLDRMRDPLGKSWHSTKKAGDFTHYGDQALVLMETVVREKGFDLDAFAADWRAFMEGYDGYFDHATKDTLIQFKNGRGPEAAGSESTDFAGAVRIAPVVALHRGDLEKMVAACRAQTAMTHNSPQVVDASEFLARTAFRVMQGQAPSAAMGSVVEEEMDTPELADWVARGKASAGDATTTAIAGFGQACSAEMAFPGFVHLVFRYEENLEEALVENVMAGGDSAARGMAAGMLLGAWRGGDALPSAWLQEMTHAGRIEELLAAMP